MSTIKPAAPAAPKAPVAAPAPAEAEGDQTKLALSDELTAAETGGWTARHAPQVLNAVAHVEAVSRFAELHAGLKPLLRGVSLVAKHLSDVKVAKSLELARYGFGALASIATGYEQYKASTTTTDSFRDVDAVVGGTVDFLFGVALPVTALIDGVLNFVLPKLAPDIKTKSGGFISGNLSTAVRGAVALLEGAATGDYRGARAFQKKADQGEYGVVFQGGFAAARRLTKLVRESRFTSWLAPSTA